MQINWTRSLTSTPKHNAFTDLCEFQQHLLCSYREATDHMGKDGALRIIQCDFEGKIIGRTRIALANCDLRDPKLTIMPDGKLLMNAYARCYDADGKWTHSRSVCWFTSDAKSWSSPRWYGEKNWWIWRLSWYRNEAFGLAYNRGQQALNWYSGHPLRRFECRQRSVLGLNSHNLGYPNESALCFTPCGTAIAITRRDADSFTAQLGICKPPYTRWQWHDLKEYIGGPAILLWDNDNLLVSGRKWTKKRFKTAIWHLSLTTKEMHLCTLLPSSGDNSYPGMVKHGDALYVSYYSSHINQTSDIFLSKLELSDGINEYNRTALSL